jgi:hypothetical protein
MKRNWENKDNQVKGKNKSVNEEHEEMSAEKRCHLDGLMVSVLAIEHKVRGFKADQGDGFLRAIKIRSTPSSGGEVKPSAP